ncbi:leucine--tRNA ligase [Patescibacteria group bacterium]|nr:leucine--tRNA ligase [Patescibacteria group bacterium]MBU1015601.1 leucine--tRNA ligase [Patescibacteria group bacterium]MBU1685008.1 leucine--tRNA ligase [Patescibacteria group bacterium]MBU1938114.1 leucine--tRNA ligase [Patescibacteria group bacterium]
MEKMYDPGKIEPKWQKYWEKNKTFRCEVDLKPARRGGKEKYYILDMFPYPSGAGLHVGHPEGYTATDIIGRYKRMKGLNVLHPIGWDAFGLPAENYAIKTGRHPREVTDENIQVFKKQVQSLGFSYDWDREVDTTDPDYYKWTQWIFLQIYKKGLAYESELPINWCPSCMTGLANEEVVNGKCDRCGAETTKKLLRQWVLKITEYADRLLEDLEEVDWPEPIKIMQRNWIGKSYGTNVVFDLEGFKEKLPIYTTRVDTLFSCAFMVLAPEHPLVYKITTDKQKKEVEKYIGKAMLKSDLERTDLAKDKTGAFTGAYAINPINGDKIPIWIGDFVLASYGTGAVFADAHDERDFEFAKRYGIPLKVSIRPCLTGRQAEDEKEWKKVEKLEKCFCDDGILVNSGKFDGMTSEKARYEITLELEKMGKGEGAVNYKMKDWVFSRQRYWGEPIPIVHCEKCGTVPVPEEELPLLLPNVKKYEPTGTGESPLAGIDEWVNTECPKCKKPAKRETNTMPQWAGSCWYYLRYISAKNDKRFVDKKEEKYWMNVDLYVGGAEHAVLHLLYARFWHKVLYDLEFLTHKEPFRRLMNQGLILGEDGEKMSKSRGNVINPDDVIRKYGADTLRLYEMFMGPFEAVKPWSTKSIEGAFRFAQKVYRIVEEMEMTDERPSPELEKLLHKTIKKVTADTESFGFNTAISQMMILANEVQKEKKVSKPLMEKFTLILSPYIPHLAEEVWEMLGHKKTLAYEKWPEYDEKLTIDDTFELVFSVNGRVRGKKEAPKDISKEDAIKAARADENVQRNILGKEVIKEIYVPGKLVNIVVK